MTGYEIEGDNRIFSSGVSAEAATSQVASRGQQPPVIPSPAGRVKVGQARARAVCFLTPGPLRVTGIHLSKGNLISRAPFPFSLPLR